MRIAYSAVVPIRIGTTAGFLIPVTLLWLGALSARAEYFYVATNGAGGDFKDWTRAATNIQEAVNVATNGDTVLVSNGVYTTATPFVHITTTLTSTSTVFLSNNITLKSVNGPAVTVIDATNYPTMTARVVFVRSGATLNGFTIRNGNVKRPFCNGDLHGGGIWANSGNLIVTNCFIYNNTADSGYGGGISVRGATNIVANCMIYSNNAYSSGGMDVQWTYSNLIVNCVFYGNRAISSTGGALGLWNTYSIVRNCLFYNNISAEQGGGIVNLSVGWSPTFENCTIVSNRATKEGGGLYIADTSGDARARNLIIYNNSTGRNFADAFTTNMSILTNCCIRDTNGVQNWNTSGNITNNPLFVNKDVDNYHLTEISPCFNTGTNQTSWMSTGVDLDSKARIRYGRVDMGAYERIRSGTAYGFH